MEADTNDDTIAAAIGNPVVGRGEKLNFTSREINPVLRYRNIPDRERILFEKVGGTILKRYDQQATQMRNRKKRKVCVVHMEALDEKPRCYYSPSNRFPEMQLLDCRNNFELHCISNEILLNSGIITFIVQYFTVECQTI